MKKPKDAEADDKNLAAEIKQRVAYLCTMIAKADRRGMSVDFQIRKSEKGDWLVTQCDIRKKF